MHGAFVIRILTTMAAALSAEDQAVVAALRRDGAAVLHNLLTPEELVAARRDQDAANREAFERPPGRSPTEDAWVSTPRSPRRTRA